MNGSPSTPRDIGSTNADGVYDIEQLSTYLACPRRYEYEHHLGIRGDPGVAAAKRQLDRARERIVRGLEKAGPLSSGPRTADRGRVDDSGNNDGAGDLGESGGAGDLGSDDRTDSFTARIRRLAVRQYLDRYGDEHGQSLLAGRRTFEYETEAATVVCPVDAIVEIDDRPVALRYRWSLDGVDYPGPSGVVQRHASGRKHYPRRAGSVLAASATIEAMRAATNGDGTEEQTAEGIPDDSTTGSTPGFAYVGLTDSVRPGTADRENDSGPDRRSIEVNVSIRRLDDHYEEERDQSLGVLEELTRAISDRAFEPNDRWEEILERECDRCPYAVMCADYVNHEVRFR